MTNVTNNRQWTLDINGSGLAKISYSNVTVIQIGLFSFSKQPTGDELTILSVCQSSKDVRFGSKAELLTDSLRYSSSVQKLGASEQKKTPRSAIAALKACDTSRDKLHQLPIGRAC
jgi:hypothetical protein